MILVQVFGESMQLIRCEVRNEGNGLRASRGLVKRYGAIKEQESVVAIREGLGRSVCVLCFLPWESPFNDCSSLRSPSGPLPGENVVFPVGLMFESVHT